MENITLTPAIIGVVSSVVTEILKFIPFLNANSVRRSLTTIIVIVIAIFVNESGKITNWHTAGTVFVQAIVYAFVSYKMVVQPLAVNSGLKTQE